MELSLNMNAKNYNGLYCLLILALLLSGCAISRIEPIDLYAGVQDAEKIHNASYKTIDNTRTKSLAVVVNQNTQNMLKYRERRAAELWSSWHLGLQQMSRIISPKPVVDGIMGVLRNEFKVVKVVSGLPEFLAGGYDFAVIVDISFLDLKEDTAGQYCEIQLNTVFIDTGYGRIDNVSASAKDRFSISLLHNADAEFERIYPFLNDAIVKKYKLALSKVIN